MGLANRFKWLLNDWRTDIWRNFTLSLRETRFHTFSWGKREAQRKCLNMWRSNWRSLSPISVRQYVVAVRVVIYRYPLLPIHFQWQPGTRLPSQAWPWRLLTAHLGAPRLGSEDRSLLSPAHSCRKAYRQGAATFHLGCQSTGLGEAAAIMRKV